MISLPTIIDKQLKEVLPEKSAWKEAWGFLLFGLGVYLALACYSFTPWDYTSTGLSARGVRNLAGPLGAHASAQVLGRFGIVGLVWPIVFMLWGAFTATGFVLVPRPRRFLGFFAATAVCAGFCELLLPRTGLPEPAFGFGGVMGQILRRSLVSQMGFGGALIALAVIGIISLVLTGNLKISRTAEWVHECFYLMRRHSRRLVKRLPSLWVRYVLNRDFEDVSMGGERFAGGRSHGEGLDVASQRRNSRVNLAERGLAERGFADANPPLANRSSGSSLAASFHMELYYDGPVHGRPESSLFSRTKQAADRSKEFKTVAASLTQQLAEFKIQGEVMAVTQGPVVTTFEFKPAPGTKVSKISALGEDLARLLKAQSLRVLAPIPGKDTVGFEVPNLERAVIGFADLVEGEEFKARKRRLPIAMGVDIFGKPVIEDLAEMPHLLVAGSTGAGKSVFMNTLVGSLICRHSAKDLRFVMIDPKMVEMAAYNDLPHMACPVITDPANEGKNALNSLVNEMEDRYRRMRAVGARNVESFNETIRARKKSEFLDFEGRWVTMPYIVLIIDEMADMMMLLGRDAETPITRLAQKARAAGIHMVIATQRPSADVVTGLIKANFPTRVAFRVLSGIDSRTILDQNGAETLLGKGDMLYLASGGARRLHGAYLSEGEVHTMVKSSAAGTRKK